MLYVGNFRYCCPQIYILDQTQVQFQQDFKIFYKNFQWPLLFPSNSSGLDLQAAPVTDPAVALVVVGAVCIIIAVILLY